LTGFPLFSSTSVFGVLTTLIDVSIFYGSTGSSGIDDPQSVLELVLARVNGTFINGAENIGGINGSITNIIVGVMTVTAEAVARSATAAEFVLPTYALGDLTTMALGAVNTGEITLGVNSAVNEASTLTTRAVSSVMTQIGGTADTGALVLNVASNASAVNGSIRNIMMYVNGSLGFASTTALGAVNTGTITSGVNAAV